MDEYSLLDAVEPHVGKKKKAKRRQEQGFSRARRGGGMEELGGEHEQQGQAQGQQGALHHAGLQQHQLLGQEAALQHSASRQERGQAGGGGLGGHTHDERVSPLTARDFEGHSSAGESAREASNDINSMIQMGLGLSASLEHKDDQEQLLMGAPFSQLSSLPVEDHGGQHHVLPVPLEQAPQPKRHVRGNDPSASWHRRAPISKGTFSKEEDELLRIAVDSYCQRKGMAPDEGRPRLLAGNYDQAFRNAWLEIGAALPERTIESLYYRARRLLTPLKSGPWTAEEVIELKILHTEMGPKWSLIGQKLDRSGTSVRDKFRELRPTKKGKWSKEELDKLQELIVQYKQNDHIPWTTIARQMDSRHHNQCRKKWGMAVKTLNTTSVVALSQDRGLVAALILQNVPSADDVDWLSASMGLPWTSSQCKSRWTLLSSSLVEDVFQRQLHLVADSLDSKLRHKSGRVDNSSFTAVKVSSPLGPPDLPVSVPLPVGSSSEELGLGRKRRRSLDLVTPMPSRRDSLDEVPLLQADPKRQRVHEDEAEQERSNQQLQADLGLMEDDPDDEIALL